MVMTHGRRFLEQPGYLRELVEKDGLEKISIHVDSTQRGRQEWSPFCTEAELHPLRDRYARLIRETRRLTGQQAPRGPHRDRSSAQSGSDSGCHEVDGKEPRRASA